MKIAYFDCPFGAGGDMLLAALLDTGINIDQWLTALSKVALPNDSYKIIIEQAQRCSLRAKKLKVVLGDQSLPEPTHPFKRVNPEPHSNQEDDEKHKHDRKHDHKQEHKHDHERKHEYHHPHSHKQPDEQKHKKADQHNVLHTHDNQRNFKDITALIAASKISEKAKDLSYRIFEKLAQAEGLVHGINPQEVHFHEVGAVDSIIDIVGFAIAYDMLAIEKSIVSPLPLGSGMVQTQHGLFPVPGPATLQLLQEAKAPISNHLIDYECLTPTAAAILTTIANNWGQAPAMKLINAIGSGAGDKNPENYPNVCRVIIGQTSLFDQSVTLSHSDRFNRESLTVIETMLDDFSPQNLSFIAEKLLEMGALDTYVTAVTAKKGRSGHLLTVLCQPINLAIIEEYIFEQTSTLGLRTYLTDRIYLNREWVNIELNDKHKGESHKIRIKVAKDLTGKRINAQPEYEDCARFAEVNSLPLKTVLQGAMKKFFDVDR